MFESLNEKVAESAVRCPQFSFSRQVCAQFIGVVTVWGVHLQVGKYFQLKERKSTFTTELRAGTVTFLTVRQPASLPRRARVVMCATVACLDNYAYL